MASSKSTTKPNIRQQLFAEVILPLPLPKLFTYLVPDELASEIAVGCRVVVPFGRNQLHTGVVFQLHQQPPESYEARPIIELLEAEPSVNRLQLDFYQWLAGYYLCTLGEVLHAALPAGLKISTTSLVQRNPHFEEEKTVLSLEEQLVMEHLSDDHLVETAKLERITGKQRLPAVLKSLAQKQAVLLVDHIREKYTPKLKKHLRLAPALASDPQALEQTMAGLEKKPKQLEVLLHYLQRVPLWEDKEKNERGVAVAELIQAGCSPSSINTLAKNGVVEVFQKAVSRLVTTPAKEAPRPLSDDQQQAHKQIMACFAQNKPVLLHGITGSGKTEIYIDLIETMLQNGHQVLYLLPEIALTAQIVARLQKVFAGRMGVYHSQYSANERVEVWRQLQHREINLVVGVRSSVFLPFTDLGLVIIDEEHEPSYKQFDPAPRYHARDAALMLARMHRAQVLLGSATPALETYYLTTTGKYGLVALEQRFGAAILPKIDIIDLGKAHKKKQMQGNFSRQMLTAIEDTLNQGDQVIIFQNRRGYAPLLTCQQCGWVPQCRHCDVSLTYHQYRNELRCHYCGYKITTPAVCQACSSTSLKTVSYGTEQLQEELQLLFPEQKIDRLDYDTTRGRAAYENIIHAFDSGRTGILVGTQMVAKGLDFERVGLVGIVNLDRMLYFPDYRATERAFQLAVQVAGRAGRQQKQGLVLIQTYKPEQPLLKMIVSQDYRAFYRYEINERQTFHYPPFRRIIKITVRHKDHQTTAQAASALAGILRQKLPSTMVLGPVVPAIARIRDRYLRQLYLKISRQHNLAVAKRNLLQSVYATQAQQAFRQVGIVIDVDPV